MGVTAELARSVVSPKSNVHFKVRYQKNSSSSLQAIPVCHSYTGPKSLITADSEWAFMVFLSKVCSLHYYHAEC
jgi:hypothetical protein